MTEQEALKFLRTTLKWSVPLGHQITYRFHKEGLKIDIRYNGSIELWGNEENLTEQELKAIKVLSKSLMNSEDMV